MIMYRRFSAQSGPEGRAAGRGGLRPRPGPILYYVILCYTMLYYNYHYTTLDYNVLIIRYDTILCCITSHHIRILAS